MKLAILTIGVWLCGCGMDTSALQCEENENQTCDQSETQSAEEEATDETEGTLKRENDDSGDEINVEVNVEVNVNTDDDEEYEDIPFMLMKRMMTWDEAALNAPDGYHLPTADELQELIGESEVISDELVNPRMVWTMSKAYETTSWAVDFNDGSKHAYDRRVYLEVIYIGDEAK